MDGLVTLYRNHIEFFSPTRSRWCVIQRPMVLPGKVSYSCRVTSTGLHVKLCSQGPGEGVMCNPVANGNFIARREPGPSSFLRKGSTTLSPERPVCVPEKRGKGEDYLQSTNMQHL